MRCGWIVAEPALARRIWQLKNLFGVNEAHPAGCLALFALKRRGELLWRARRIVDTNRARWTSFLAGRSDLAVSGESVGTTVFPKVLLGDADALCALMRARYETSLVPGRFFGAPAHVRIGLCGDSAIFSEGLSRLGSALNDMKGGS